MICCQLVQLVCCAVESISQIHLIGNMTIFFLETVVNKCCLVSSLCFNPVNKIIFTKKNILADALFSVVTGLFSELLKFSGIC